MRKKVIFAMQPKEHGEANNPKGIHIIANVFLKVMRTNENIGFHRKREQNWYPINHTNAFQEK